MSDAKQLSAADLHWPARKFLVDTDLEAVRSAAGLRSQHAKTQAATARVREIEFGLLRAADLERMSYVEVTNSVLYQPNKREPYPGGALDRRLGTSDKRLHCATCGKQLVQCLGHFGDIKLQLPVFHIGFFKEAQRVLQCICKTCSAILLDDGTRAALLARMRRWQGDSRMRSAVFKEVIDTCKKATRCPRCRAANGQVKKLAGVFRLVHILKDKAHSVEIARFQDEFRQACRLNRQLREFLRRANHDLDPLTTLRLFRGVSDEDCVLLNMRPEQGRPEDLLITTLAVPPVCIRPSVPMGSSGTNEDDLTVKLNDVLYINNFIRSSLEKGSAPSVVMENWEFLQQQVAMYINSDLPGFPSGAAGGRQTLSLTQRLKGKMGRFRGNLSGKRVDFSSRSVISPDPNLSIDEVGVPEHVAMTLTYPERVNAHNIARLRECVRNGPSTHPGANQVEYSRGGFKVFLQYANRAEIAARLREGDVVERHLCDGDVVLFNRQPSLHRMSIMAHRVRVMPWRTLRFNECVCTPYNADFDGDEMNVHVPQTEEARAEALVLMGVRHNLVTPRHGEPLIAAIQDFITAAYLLTQKDTFFDHASFCAAAAFIGDANEHIDVPPPAILKPVRLWTGKQLFSLVLRPNRDSRWPRLNLEAKARNYEDGGVMDARDGYVLIRNSVLLCGNLCKTTLGGSKKGIFYALIRDYSVDVAAVAMNRVAKLAGRWIGTRGFSIGVTDVMPSQELAAIKNELVRKGYEDCMHTIGLFREGRLPAQAGLDDAQTLEARCLKALSDLRERLGSHCLQKLNYNHNSPLIMAVCGSKGSNINISQMVACVGQQAVSGSRIQDGFSLRSLPHFQRGDRGPAARGFVQNSFFTGLTATEFFFHTMGGREGLVDTAVKTADTGYMQRRLMKALEDMCVQYDGTVRTAEQAVVQFVYGDDGLDPMSMADGALPVNLAHQLLHVQAMHPALYASCLSVEETARRLRARIASPAVSEICSQSFVDALIKFVDKEAKNGTVMSAEQIEQFVESTLQLYRRALIEPGTTVGALAAQSIGEPGTQMTLKTFHFAGVASMNITQGVPRLREIINAAREIGSPIITAELVTDGDEKSARIVKGRLEVTRLSDVCAHISEVLSDGRYFIEVQLDLEAIEALMLRVDAHSVAECIEEHPKLRRSGEVTVLAVDRLVIDLSSSGGDKGDALARSLALVRTWLPSLVVSGIPGIARAVINVAEEGRDGKRSRYNLLIEGSDMRRVMNATGVKGSHVTCNHIMEVERVLGIEAARATIIREINATMQGHGLSLDNRHVQLLADTMTFKGAVLGITRFGVARSKDSVLMLASFEQTADHLFEAAIRGRADQIAGVSESVILGLPISVGTGICHLLLDKKKATPPAAPAPGKARAVVGAPRPQLLVPNDGFKISL